MKSLGLLVLLSLTGQLFADVTVTKDEAAQIRTYQIGGIQGDAAKLKGKIVQLQFFCRSSVTEKGAGGAVSGEITDSPSVRQRLEVEVPVEGVPWFEKIPQTDAGAQPLLVYARITVDKHGETLAKLLGIREDAAPNGVRIAW